MATTTTNKMSSLVKKGNLTGLQVVRLIHQHYIESLVVGQSATFTEGDLQKLISNLRPSEWQEVKPWVHDGIGLLHGFAMNAKSNAALAASDIHFINTFLTVIILGNETTITGSDKVSNNLGLWEEKALSAKTYAHSALWNNESLKVVSEYMRADWVALPAIGMGALDGAARLANKTLQALEQYKKLGVIENFNLDAVDLDSLKPSSETIKEWEVLIKEVEVQDFLLRVERAQMESWELYKESLRPIDEAA